MASRRRGIPLSRFAPQSTPQSGGGSAFVMGGTASILKNMSKLVLIVIMAAALLSGAMADGQDFTVSIVGQWQSNKSQFEKEGLPIVYCPKIASTKLNVHFGEPSSNCFFVVIQNTQKVADTMTMNSPAWYECLQFIITDGSGKIYSVSPAPIDWPKNIPETWTFPSGGMRVMAVDFTSSAMVGQQVGWQGLPPTPSEPEIVTMTVTFRYYDSAGKQISVTSKPTEVYLCSK